MQCLAGTAGMQCLILVISFVSLIVQSCPGCALRKYATAAALMHTFGCYSQGTVSELGFAHSAQRVSSRHALRSCCLDLTCLIVDTAELHSTVALLLWRDMGTKGVHVRLTGADQ